MPDGASSSGAAWQRVARGGVSAFVIYGISSGLAYCTQLVIARLVGAAEYGVYAYVFAWVTVLAYFAALGFDVSLLRFVPTYQARQAFGLMRGIIRYAEWVASIVGVCVAVAGALAVTLSADRWSHAHAGTVLIGLALVPVWALQWIRCSTARAFGGVISALAPERIVRDSVLLMCLAALAGVFDWHVDARQAMGATLVGSAVALFCVSLAARQLRPRALQDVACTYEARIWLRAAAPLVLLGTVEPLLNRAGVILLGWMGDVTAAGIYAMAFNVSFLVVLPRTAVNVLFAPAAAELHARHDRAALQALTARAAVWTLASAACVALPLALLAAPILGLLGRGFDAGALALRVLLVGQVFAAGAGSPLYLMTMTGHERPAAVFLTLSAAINVGVGVALIHQFGLAGAAVATAIAIATWNVAMGVFIWRKLDLLTGVLGIFRAPFTQPRETAWALPLRAASHAAWSKARFVISRLG